MSASVFLRWTVIAKALNVPVVIYAAIYERDDVMTEVERPYQPWHSTVMPKDEHYIIDLCDRVLGARALRQHRFPFLKGDAGRRGTCRLLPVDAFYPDLALVVEYRERQHLESIHIRTRGRQ